MNEQIVNFKLELKKEIEEDILPFWMDKMVDVENGGFFGRMNGMGEVIKEADKGAIMNARILWAFSSSYRVLHDTQYLKCAERARKYLMDKFIDYEYGGVFWALNCHGDPISEKKQTYAIGFAIYGLTEYARATGDESALEAAIKLYHDIENNAFDNLGNGYVEALTRDWKPIVDMRLSDKDENCSRSMNTHLHIIEPYTNLLRCLMLPVFRHYDNEYGAVRKSVETLIRIFLDKIMNKETYHLDLFFTDDWSAISDKQSFGHDIEAVWLLHEAALVVGKKEIINEVETIIRKIAIASEEGLQKDGSLIFDRNTESGFSDTQRQWWVICENIIGHMDLYQFFRDKRDLSIALQSWEYIKTHLIDRIKGEWFWGADEGGKPNTKDDKAGFWKGPYHNSRMCLEIIERIF